jgi:hypothetical protein
MHFAKTRNLVFMAIAWAIFLFAYDQHQNPRPLATYWAEFRGKSTRPTEISHTDTPRLRLSMPHLCCTGCLSEVRDALKQLTWLAPARLVTQPPPVEVAEAEGTNVSTAHEIEFDILDLNKANFVELDRALRESGLVADRVEVFGIGHYRLEVELPHICCSVCSRAVDEQLRSFLQKETQGRWVDSMTTDHIKKTVTIYARLNAVADMEELKRALDRSGFAAHSVKILTGPES